MVDNIHLGEHYSLVNIIQGGGGCIFCGGDDCMWWWLYVVVVAVLEGDGHSCACGSGGITALLYTCMVVVVYNEWRCNLNN